MGFFGASQLVLNGWPISDTKLSSFAFIFALLLVPLALLTRLMSVGFSTSMNSVSSGINNKTVITIAVIIALLCYNAADAGSTNINKIPSLYLTDHSLE